MQYKTECAKEQLQELSNDISSALDKHKDVQNQLLQLQKELRSIETKKNVQKLISKASEKFYGLIGKTVNDREKDALKAKVKALEGENEQLSDRLGKAILEKEQNGTKAFKAENDKEYYRQQMDNARTTSNRLRTENQETPRSMPSVSDAMVWSSAMSSRDKRTLFPFGCVQSKTTWA